MSRVVFCNNDITDVKYSGFTITKIYACGGELVYSADTCDDAMLTYRYMPNGQIFTTPYNAEKTIYESSIVGTHSCESQDNNYAHFELGNCVKAIDDNVFCSYGRQQWEIVIPASIESIGSNVFSNTPLPSIKFLGTNPPTIQADSFSGTTCPILVPCLAPYLRDTNWLKYESRLVSYDTCGSGNKFSATYSDSSTYTIPCASGGTLTLAETSASTAPFTSMVSATVGNCVAIVGDNAFSGFTSLSSVTVSEGVVRLKDEVFSECSSLKNVDLPSTTTYIGGYAFYHCSSLESLTVRAVEPPTLGGYALLGTSTAKKIYVPAESVEAYKTASRWNNYSNYIQAIQ